MKSNVAPTLRKVAVNIGRFIVAAVFIFSGFVKIIDPLGFFYKLQDYTVAFSLDVIPDFVLLISSFALSAFEFLLGIYLFFGVRRKLSLFMSLLLMSFMTPLTLALALLNPISDCGCFGDAIVLTNWETFGKNVFLLLLIIYLYRHSRDIIRVFSIETNWIVSSYSVLFILVLGGYCLYYLPVLDFRPYKIGTDIPVSMIIPEGAKEPEFKTTYIMEKDGIQKEFDLENYPDDSWNFIDAKTELVSAGYVPSIQNFTISDMNTGEDLTDSILSIRDYNFILIAHRISKADDSNIDLINEIYDYSRDNSYNFICLTSSPKEDIEEWRDKTGAEYPFYLSDDITLKTIIRSNPGLLLLKNGVIYNKWDYHSLPTEFDLNASLSDLELGKLEYRSATKTVFIVIAWYLGPLFILFGLDRLWQWRRNRK